ncbi:MAG: hypothetical protein C0601_10985 [Candidatus Muiribacterium halophilum]|uniref:Glycosyl transferase family 1 n=1 Tax=Muiribacterium halophilum TaxID=2053465 RepID=A0A2N5ZBT6_MUIH1|nr:MAG: hypothetical protein C0601_10985 [Candidatus Muirbacterium halophilum]
MKITQIGKYYPPYKGGIENHLFSLVNNIKNEVEELTVEVFNDSFFSSKEVEGNVTIKRNGKLFEVFSTPFSLSMFFSFLGDDSDIYHIHMPNPSAHLLMKMAGLPKDKKLVISHHSDIVAQKFVYKFYKPLMKKIYQRADAIIAATPYHVQYSDILPEFEEKVKIIPYGINIDSFEKDKELLDRIKRIKEFLGENSKNAVFVGRLVYYKGVSFLVDAFKQIDGDYNLIIVGNGPYYSTLKAQSMEDKRIIFIPEADDVQLKAILNSSDIFVLPSIETSEAFGIVQLEAMACSIPVISTNVDSGMKEVNIDKKTGIKVPPKDVDHLKDALKNLFENDEYRNQL